MIRKGKHEEEDHITNVPDSLVVLACLRLPPQQPGEYFDKSASPALIASIKHHGILKPLLVRPLSEGIYEIVEGKKRYLAAQAAGLTEIPVIVLQIRDGVAVQYTPIENSQHQSQREGEKPPQVLLLPLVALFARVGAMAIGGSVPIHLWDSFVRKGWLTEKEYLEALNWCQCLPGPNGSNLSAYLGYRFQGVWGSLLSPIAMLLPGASLLLLLSSVLAKIPQQHLIQEILLSVAAAAIGLLLGATWKLSRSALSNSGDLLVTLVTFVLVGIFRVPIPLVIGSMAIVIWYLHKGDGREQDEHSL